MLRLLMLLLVLLTASTLKADGVDYLREIKPIFQQKCYACHGAFQQKAGLRVDTAAALKKGGESGPALVDRQADQSLLLQALTGKAGFQMPPEGEGAPLTAEELNKVRRWIEDGAPLPSDEKPQIDPKLYWSYVIPQRHELPVVKHSDWIRTPIDAFIAAEHDRRGLVPQPSASREAWLRRVFLDLIGLPPTRDELRAFLADTSPQAEEKVVNELLARPQYGERWGRHWMDIWRYSDWYGSRGINEIRYSQRHIWRWRDWIVESLNADKGYDRMIREMLAADELSPDDPAQLPATGFVARNWYKFDRNVWMFEAVERPAEAFLAVTLRCCRCHDHKYDPISQQEYYQFRAFFEPHQVRTDPLSALTETEKDATLGPVLKDGIPRIYDKELDVATYRFIRGDDRLPDKDKPLNPGVPAALGGAPLKIEPITLPATGFYPLLRRGVRDTLLEKADLEISKTEEALRQAGQKVAEAQSKLAAFDAGSKSDAGQTDGANAASNAGEKTAASQIQRLFFEDNFAQSKPDVWQMLDGQWVYENGHVVEKSTGSFSTMVTKQPHPQDFRVRITYRTLPAGTYRSIGFSFDFQDKGNSQDVYTSCSDARQTVQAFHRVGGAQNYPAAGIVDAKIKVGDVIALDVVAEGQKLTIDVNGERKLNYVMPIARRPGRFALWTHAGSAEFLSLRIDELRPSREQLATNVKLAEQQRDLAAHAIELARSERASIEARLAAEIAKYATPQRPQNEVENLAREASKAERQVAVVRAQRKVIEAEQHLSLFAPTQDAKAASVTSTPEPASAKPASLTDAEKKLTDAKAELLMAEQAVQQPDGKYQPLGEQFPQTSTGRRLALANWIASEKNPRTARVAVNHIWGRHFGQPLVATTENFGLNGAEPSHPELLDWLATELVRSGWQMKPLHRLIVLSNTYRLASSDQNLSVEAHADRNREIDPVNQYLWHANSRRMEAEVVRDSVLFLAGTLDLTRGGPEIPEAQGQTSLRRSLYFRNTPNEKMPFLEVFDVADPNSCYRRKESVVPQQALALMNSALAQDQARTIAETLSKTAGAADDPDMRKQFVIAAFEHLLSRQPASKELDRCLQFLEQHKQLLGTERKTAYSGSSGNKRPPASDPVMRSRENLIEVLLLHNDFVTIR